ncbi:Adenylate and Guanylate cyclase catalytic domain containing protein [Trichomonas vaginalis G3]|uniref:Adenylate and Guanylate cyclase catalytic domain containing protein n=1 Tax=Trichomonas vaginalis (strain ATCC PRA-98 / G3) TaxID=412133 RepID=A2FBV8_TRIV3|nr:guanylate cyclase protein [Trichomonas vaginalis G3]EAX97604.1 Adenylate and Guanylate cyclase catalytic domain containing protein [Trichomonas vaginalis G3]KAI5510582.1 guanylate cyclase protein [Trichomonas vaginalis G3]|eukprot:XP_001310534.1 Adenylate and Guanylate cyclase catalytic domain containing protein [Trichomonas vaginalis G3]
MDTLSIKKGIHHAMMYIVVGLYGICDYFIDGSVSNFILNQPQLEAAVAIMLQIITFFPSESKKMDLLFKRVLTKRKLNLAERFLIYQCYRIKVRRLVSDTKDTLETFNKLKAKNDTVKSIIKSFWDKQDADNSFLSNLSITVNDVNSLFKACLASNPNNLRMTNEYANFLAECKCDFDAAIIESIKADMIADGRNFNVDISFRSVVNKFPRYLKDKVLDVKGRRVLKGNMKSNGSESKNSSSSSRNDSFDSKSVDFERQELVSKKILRDAKVRLAFHHAIMDTRPWQYNTIAMLTLWDVLLICVFFIGFYAYLLSNLRWRRSSYSDLSDAGYATFYSVYANVYTLSKFASDNGRYNTSNAILGNISIDDGTVETLLPTEYSMGMKTFFCLNKSNMYLRTLLQSLADQAMDDNDPYEIASILIAVNSSFNVCDKASPQFKIKASLKALVLVINYHSNYLAGVQDEQVIPNIFENNDYCQIMSNIPMIATNADETFRSILNYNVEKASTYKAKFMTWMIVGSLMIFFGIALPAVIIINTYNSMVDRIIKVLLALPSAVKEDAKRPLMINSSEDKNELTTSKVESSNIMEVLPRIFFFFLFGIVGTYIAFCYTSIQVNDRLTLILKWFYYSCTRITMASQLGNNALQLIFLNGSLNQSIMDRDALVQIETSGLQKLRDAESILLQGNDEIKGSIGYDAKLDQMNIQSQCTLGRDPKTIHDMYACGSIDAQIHIFRQKVEEVIKTPEHFNGAMNNEVAANMAHILRFHFYPCVIRATKRISEVMENAYDKAMRFDILFVVIGMICMVIIFTLPWFFRDFVIQNYRMLLMALQHLPPQTIVDTPEILEIFSRRKKSNKAEKMSVSKSIVYGASECIIITNSNSVIEIVNQSVTDNIGLTPDQMLGQHIANFVSDNDQQRLNQQIDLMVNGQGSSFWQDHLQLTNDNNEMIPFSVTMIGMKDNDESTDIKSFVYILTNETDEIEKRKAAEEAKAKSEKLLYQILPKDIVIRLNRGETDISFSIPSATIFFIDIVKFSAYTANLTPSEIMANLSLVFATFDGIVSEYPSITKIKLIGDVYMAAAGLFQTEEDKYNHAEDAVRCCLRVQKAMEEINMKLNASLEVRIGVNSGGPLIGGVLGTDKPTFDIIGDTINVAARLQSTDIPGNVQISGDTKAMIENLDFEIEERGEIDLKGKGNRLTYFVNLPKQNDLEQSFTATITGRKE